MLKNTMEAGMEHVRFVSYDGRYPNFCTGELILEINGMTHYFSFRFSEKTDDTHHLPFWGRPWFCDTGEWETDCLKLNKHLLPYAAEIDKIFNENVQQRCCGGCR